MYAFIYMCVCVCVCVCMYVGMYVCMYARMYELVLCRSSSFWRQCVFSYRLAGCVATNAVSSFKQVPVFWSNLLLPCSLQKMYVPSQF